MQSKSSLGAVTPVHPLRAPDRGTRPERAIRDQETHRERSRADHNLSAAMSSRRNQQLLKVDVISGKQKRE